ncbi:MAG: UDP-glucose/GDP-mannose dehydrogenase family protein [Anaerolineae bacterium]|nr:UDP-glucose/GDP-mannose dehydrogenase family protein [Anaerolineae bacterium]
MKHIAIIGTGYVGLVTGACFADLGNQVVCIDIDEAKIAQLDANVMPIFEPGLEEIVRRNRAGRRLSFTLSYAEGLRDAEFVFIAVNTPEGMEGEADLRYVRSAAQQIAEALDHDAIVVNKSTVPIGTGDLVASLVDRYKQPGVTVAVVSNPEFLREGSAVHDCQHPDRVVLGSQDRIAAEQVAQLYLPLRCPIMITDLRTAEMIKYASNAFLATRLSFINEIASICDQMGADVKEVAEGMGYDKRIGQAFLRAGLGWGGSCFPKDVQALAYMASTHGTHPQLLRAVIDINRYQRRRVVRQLREWLGGLDGRQIGLLGLSFKPDTDDMRSAPSIEVAHLLHNEGAAIRAYDPAAMENARRVLPEVELCHDAYAVAEGSDALVLITEWNEFRQLDKARLRQAMRQPYLIDGRNIYDAEEMRRLGFVYWGMGRGKPSPGQTALSQS